MITLLDVLSSLIRSGNCVGLVGSREAVNKLCRSFPGSTVFAKSTPRRPASFSACAAGPEAQRCLGDEASSCPCTNPCQLWVSSGTTKRTTSKNSPEPLFVSKADGISRPGKLAKLLSSSCQFSVLMLCSTGSGCIPQLIFVARTPGVHAHHVRHAGVPLYVRGKCCDSSVQSTEPVEARTVRRSVRPFTPVTPPERRYRFSR